MRRKSSGVAVAGVLIGVAVAAVVYIASIGHSRHADAPVPHSSALASAQDAEASQAAFGAEPKAPEASPAEQSAAR